MKIKLFLLFLSIVLSTCWISPERRNESADYPQHTIQSKQDRFTFNDFITSVHEAPDEDKQAIVDSFMFWADSVTGIPYIEDSTAYFLYINGSNPSVAVAGDFTGWDPANQGFNHLDGTNLFYRAYDFESDARLDYKFVVNGNWILDPLNPMTTSGGFGPNSELSMLSYIQPPEIQSYDIPHGTVTYHNFSDSTQGRTRAVRVYTPPRYTESDDSYRSIYFHDGQEQLNLGFTRNTLDFLIHHQLIPPVIGVFVDPTNRNEEYSYDLDFMEMFVSELVPWVDNEYRTIAEAESRAIAGVSLGGLTSLLFTVHHPEVFGNCGAYSSAIWFGDLIEQYGASQVLQVKIYMDAGTYEPSIYTSSLALRDILADEGWEHTWKVWHEGHSWGSWRAHLDEALLYFWPLTTTGIDDRY